jgi:hypothetical protein
MSARLIPSIKDQLSFYKDIRRVGTNLLLKPKNNLGRINKYGNGTIIVLLTLS